MRIENIKVGDAVYRREGDRRVFVGNVQEIVRKLKNPDEVHSVTTTANVSTMINKNVIQSSLVIVNTPKGWKSFFNPGFSRNTLFEILHQS